MAVRIVWPVPLSSPEKKIPKPEPATRPIRQITSTTSIAAPPPESSRAAEFWSAAKVPFAATAAAFPKAFAPFAEALAVWVRRLIAAAQAFRTLPCVTVCVALFETLRAGWGCFYGFFPACRVDFTLGVNALMSRWGVLGALALWACPVLLIPRVFPGLFRGGEVPVFAHGREEVLPKREGVWKVSFPGGENPQTECERVCGETDVPEHSC